MFLRLLVIAQYLAGVLLDGNELNDWLSWMDHETAAQWEQIGHAIARMLGQ